MKRKHRRLLLIAGLAGGGFVAYRYGYKPWKAARDAAAAAGGTVAGSGTPSLGNDLLNWISNPLGGGGTPAPSVPLPAPSTLVTAPTPVGPTPLPAPIGATTLGPQYGGDLGACISYKGGTWSAAQCQARLDAITTAAKGAVQAIAELSQPQAASNPAGMAEAVATIAAEQAALAQAQTAYAALMAAGNTAGAATYQAAIIGHQNDIADIQARINAASAPAANDNSAAIAAWEGQLAALKTDYRTLTKGGAIPGVG